jgi:hypothetical protein
MPAASRKPPGVMLFLDRAGDLRVDLLLGHRRRRGHGRDLGLDVLDLRLRIVDLRDRLGLHARRGIDLGLELVDLGAKRLHFFEQRRIGGWRASGMMLLGGRGVSAGRQKRSCRCGREQLDAHVHSKSPLPGWFALPGPVPRPDDTCVTVLWRLQDGLGARRRPP